MLETIVSWSVANPIFQTAIVGFARGIVGYLQNWIDSKQPFDFNKFLVTFPRVFVQILGLAAMGFGPEAAFITDWVVGKALPSK